MYKDCKNNKELKMCLSKTVSSAHFYSRGNCIQSFYASAEMYISENI